MQYHIFILPNSTDNWITNPPFNLSLAAGQLGYCLSDNTNSGLTDYVLIPGKLLDVSTINQSINLFDGNNRSVDGKLKLDGIGGVASSSDFSFILERTNVAFVNLIGRTVKVAIDYTSDTIYDIGHADVNILFTGKIKKVKPARDSVELSCSGLLATLQDRSIGTLTNYDSDIYKSKIIPIVYGDFTDDNAFLSTVLNKNLSSVPDIVVDNQTLKSISGVFVYDPDTNTKILKDDLGNLSINGNTISIKRDVGITLVSDLNIGDTEMQIYDPPTVAFEISGSPVLDTTSVYNFPTYTPLVFVEMKDGYYIFAAPSMAELPYAYSGTLTWVSGTDAGPLTFTWRSDPLQPKIFPDITEESGLNLTSAKAMPLIVQVGNETIQAYYLENYYITSGYAYTKLLISRATNNSTEDNHLAGDEVYILGSSLSARWEFKHRLWVENVSNFSGIPSLVSGDLKNLSSMHNSGMLSSDVAFLTSGELYLDLVFPMLTIKGDVVSAHLLGKYDVDSDAEYSSPLYNTDYGSFVYLMVADQVRVESFLKNSNNSGLITLDYAGSGMLNRIKYPNSRHFEFPFYELSGTKRTISVLAVDAIDSLGASKSFRLEAYPDYLYDGNDYEDAYSLRNKIIPRAGDETYRDVIMGSISNFLEQRFSIWMTNRDAEGTFWIANPGLLLTLSINPLENQIYIQGQGRTNILGNLIERPQDILIDLLAKELLFTNVTDNVGIDRNNWKLAVSISEQTTLNNIADKICKQGGLILSDGADGSLYIDSISPADGTPTTIASSDISINNNMPDITEEYTDMTQLVTALSIAYQKNFATETYPLVSGSFATLLPEMVLAKNVTEFDQPCTLESDLIRDGVTVDNLAETLIDYHYKPMRILNIALKISNYALRVGKWIRINSTAINSVADCIYLIVATDTTITVPDACIKIKCIEFSGVESTLYQDTTDGTTKYQDVSDGTTLLQDVT